MNQRRTEAPVEGLRRADADTLAATIPGTGSGSGSGSAAINELLLHGFEFDGNVVDTGKLHLRRLSPTAVEITSLAYSLGEWRFLVRDSASYFGLGEHFDTLNRAHTIVRNASQDNGGPKGASTYKPMPFFMSTSGYGLWVDTTAEATFDLNVSVLNEIAITVPAEKLRIVLFTGPEFPKILEQFTALTQRAVLPPYWAFAPWMGRSFVGGDAQVRETVDKARDLHLPGSVVLMDEPWATSFNSYKFNSKQFGDATGDIKHVHDAAYKLVLWHTPWINSASNPPGNPAMSGKEELHAETYDEAASHHYFVRQPDGAPWVGRWWMGEGSLIDFTNPTAKAWWQDQLRAVIHAGADGFKNDDAEGNFQGDGRFADGTAPELMRNRYAVLYQNAVQEVIEKELKGNGVLFGRSATQGANGLGFLWGGDNESSFSPENGLPTVVMAGLNAGLSGIPLWTSDVGGYIDSPSSADPALLARWTEFAAFTPVMEVFSSTNRLPWEWPAAALEVYRKYATLHMSLFPYRYAAAQESAKTGMPPIRALALVYQNDPQARICRDEYLFGPDLLVAPVIDRNTRRPVYLPAGQWVDYWTGMQVSGGQTVLVEAPLDVLPLWVRAGAVIPKIPEDVMTLVPEKEGGNKTVKSLDDRRVYELTGSAAPTGESEITDFEGRKIVRGAKSITIRGDAAKVTVRWRFADARSVTVNGAAAKLIPGKDGSNSVEFDHNDKSVVAW